jgi:hypothetical protein
MKLRYTKKSEVYSVTFYQDFGSSSVLSPSALVTSGLGGSFFDVKYVQFRSTHLSQDQLRRR